MNDNAPLTVQSLMREGLAIARAEWDVITLAEFFIEYRVKAAPVIDQDGRMLGVVGLDDVQAFTLESDRLELPGLHPFYTDRLEYTEEELHEGIDVRDDESIRVADLCQPIVHTISVSTPLPVVCRLMSMKRLQRLVVLDETGKPCGGVSTLDIVGILADHWQQTLP